MTALSAPSTRRLYDSTDSLLRFAMRADSIVTGLCGVGIVLAADQIAALDGLAPAEEYGLGAFLVLCGLTVFGLAARPNLRRAGIAVVVVNIVYTVAAVAVVVAGLLPLAAWGVAATLASAVYTAFFAVLQGLGVRRLQA